MNLQIGVIGGEESSLERIDCDKSKVLDIAYNLGNMIAKVNGILVTGGQSGVMEYSSKGVFDFNGIVLSTPGPNRNSSNKYVSIEACTPINIGDYLFAGILSTDVIFVLPGGFGTLAEIYLACRFNKKLVFIQGISDYIIEKCFTKFNLSYDNLEVLSLVDVLNFLEDFKIKNNKV